ncbi:hypothetical protein ACX12L_07775 [Alicycliphilus sp. T452]|jgi:hypothetical protein
MRASRTPGHTAAWAIALCAFGLCTATGSHAATARPHQETGATAHAPAKKSRSTKVKHQQNHSGESAAERDRRLYRECRGLPNAGACLGYTRR